MARILPKNLYAGLCNAAATIAVAFAAAAAAAAASPPAFAIYQVVPLSALFCIPFLRQTLLFSATLPKQLMEFARAGA